MAKDKQACDEVYREIKSSVEGGFEYLIQKRKEDPYKDLLPRVVYEFSRGEQRQAPSFEP